MSSQDDGQERTHQATERRKQQFRERGEIARSRELTSAIGLLATTLAISIGWAPMMSSMRDLFRRNYAFEGAQDLDIGDCLAMIADTIRELATLLGLPLGIIFVVALAGGLAQSQMVIPKEPLKIKWEKLNLAAAFKEKFLSSQPWMELGKGLLKLFVLGLLV